MINVGVFFGSRSAEHDVSIITGLQVLENLDKTKYTAFPVYISKKGEWFVGEPLKKIDSYRPFKEDMHGITKVILPPVPSMNGLYSIPTGGLFAKAQKVCDLDCAILAVHGMHGEDGSIQGLLELADIPYSSCSLVGSSVGMDKIIMKGVFKSMGLPVLDGTYCYRSAWLKDREPIIEEAEKIGYPLFVKPANLGSSIGISKATDRRSFIDAMEVAIQYDRRILIEKGLDCPTEINCACIGFDGEVTPSLCEQPKSWTEFLSFEDKYTRGSGSKGMKSLSRSVPAPITDEMTELIQSYTAQIFKMLECKGVVRVDYMIDRMTNQVYVGEINTIPGSFAFYLFEPMGIPFKKLLDNIIDDAFKALEQKKKSSFAYASDILEKATGGGTKGVKR